MISIDPTSGAELARYDSHGAEHVEQALADARREFERWRRLSFSERAERMVELAHGLRHGLDPYAELMAREMGKPLREGHAEVEKCAWAAEFYSAYSEEFLAPQKVVTESTSAEVHFRPMGPLFGIMPWNFPLWQVMRFAAPALMAGNAVLFKPAPGVAGCALALEAAFIDAGFPPGLMHALLIDESEVGSVVQDPRVAAITLTGSPGAGRAVAAQAGSALKKIVLELGGSDPYLVLDDADCERAVECCFTSRMINGGQSCIAAKRMIVTPGIRPEFQRQLQRRLEQVRMGPPLEAGVTLGPLARGDLRETLHRQVQESIERGARCLLGGEIPPGEGCFYPPTLLTDVAPGMPAHDEELFGPVAVIVPAADEEQAIRLANLSSFGLGAAIFTRNEARGIAIARDELEAGCCAVNDFVRSDPRLPFGGVKQSGHGRELGRQGIHEFAYAKALSVA